MKTLIRASLLILVSILPLAAQFTNPVRNVTVAPTGACTTTLIYKMTTTGVMYTCQLGFWGPVLQSGTGQFTLTGQTGTTPAAPASGFQKLFFNSATNREDCINTDSTSCSPAVAAILTSTSGPVTDPGGYNAYQYNNASGAIIFNAPAGAGNQKRCYRNATGKSGAITVQFPDSNTVDLAGANSSNAGSLVSGGALGDEVCIVSDAANHWYATVLKGTWSKT